MNPTPRTGAAPSGPRRGQRVGGYELLTRLGEGGMGVVHLARDRSGQRVALKLIRPNVVGDDESRARLEREVNSLSRVRSRRVAEVIDADPWGPVPYVATRYVPGLSLHDHVAQEGPLDDEDLLWFARCLAEALGDVHAAGVLHRDVKPSNVLMEGRSPVLIDFGLARVADDPRLTAQGWLLGTPGYLAPEILRGEDATVAADVHSWAATVAYAGTGRSPFGQGPSAAVMDRVRRGEHDLTGLPDDVREVVDAALEPLPRHRPTLVAIESWLDFDDVPLTVVRREERWADDSAETDDDAETVHVPYDENRAGTRVMRTHDDFPEHDYAAHPLAEHEFGEEDFGEEDDSDEPDLEPEGDLVLPARASVGERIRRATLNLALGGVVAGAVMHAPYVVGIVLLVVVWLLRSGSKAHSALEVRRGVRGRRWFDVPWTWLSTPYHSIAAVPGTLALVAWAAGAGLAVALLCFSLALDVQTSLALVGVGVAFGAWAGPGGGRVRRPVRRMTRPLAARGWVWVLALAALGGLAGFLVVTGFSAQADWAPASGPFWG